jgi:hypothetical protein
MRCAVKPEESQSAANDQQQNNSENNLEEYAEKAATGSRRSNGSCGRHETKILREQLQEQQSAISLYIAVVSERRMA